MLYQLDSFSYKSKLQGQSADVPQIHFKGNRFLTGLYAPSWQWHYEQVKFMMIMSNRVYYQPQCSVRPRGRSGKLQI